MCDKVLRNSAREQPPCGPCGPTQILLPPPACFRPTFCRSDPATRGSATASRPRCASLARHAPGGFFQSLLCRTRSRCRAGRRRSSPRRCFGATILSATPSRGTRVAADRIFGRRGGRVLRGRGAAPVRRSARASGGCRGGGAVRGRLFKLGWSVVGRHARASFQNATKSFSKKKYA